MHPRGIDISRTLNTPAKLVPGASPLLLQIRMRFAWQGMDWHTSPSRSFFLVSCESRMQGVEAVGSNLSHGPFVPQF